MMSEMPDATSEKEIPQPGLRVLYIGGWGRSGSTLLDRMLGQVPGFFALGEVREIWQSGLRENRLCGCGASFRECPFWTRVGAEAFGGWDRLPLAEVLKLWRAYDRPWALPRLFRRHPTAGPPHPRQPRRRLLVGEAGPRLGRPGRTGLHGEVRPGRGVRPMAAVQRGDQPDPPGWYPLHPPAVRRSGGGAPTRPEASARPRRVAARVGRPLVRDRLGGVLGAQPYSR